MDGSPGSELARANGDPLVGVVIRREVLGREVARRGWTLADLAKAAGLSGATVTAASAGRPVSPGSLRRIAGALASVPPLDGVDELLLG
jgi:transcriptional regulator with XRE-family HTH domain